MDFMKVSFVEQKKEKHPLKLDNEDGRTLNFTVILRISYLTMKYGPTKMDMSRR